MIVICLLDRYQTRTVSEALASDTVSVQTQRDTTLDRVGLLYRINEAGMGRRVANHSRGVAAEKSNN